MPLSEREQKLLEQLEQQLSADSAFANQMRSSSTSPLNTVRLALGAIAVLAGLGIVVAGVSTQLIWLGVIGFVVMVLGGYLLATPRHSRRGRPDLRSVTHDGRLRDRRPAARPGNRVMDRLAARWEERRRKGEL